MAHGEKYFGRVLGILYTIIMVVIVIVFIFFPGESSGTSPDIKIREIDGHEYIIYEDRMNGLGAGITHSASCTSIHNF